MRKLMIGLLAATTLVGGCATYGDDSRYASYSQYDYDHPDPRYNGYYADNYYHSDRRYREYRLNSNDRIYRGRDGRYYCRRSDGSTGLIVGAVAGGILGSIIAPGDSKPLGAVIGAIGGGAAGAAIDSNNPDVRCQ